jgi:hypothetical protein
MTRTKILLLCVPLAAGGLGLSLHATFRTSHLEREVASAASAGEAAGASFVETLQGEHAERQRLALDRRRELAVELAAARRDRLLGFLAVAAAGLAGSALSVMSRISAEVEEDRRHVGRGAAEDRPERS